MLRTRLLLLVSEIRRDLGVVLGRDQDLKRRAHRPVGARELGAVFGESHLILFRLHAGRLIAARPQTPAVGVAKIEIVAPSIAGCVLGPARQGQIAPAAVARTGGRQHHGVATVGQQVRLRRRIVRACAAGEPPACSVSLTRAVVVTSSARGWLTETSRGVRSCSSSSVACTSGSAWKSRTQAARRAARWRSRTSSCPGDAPCTRARSRSVAPSGRRLRV